MSVKCTDNRSPVYAAVNTLEINTTGAFVQPGGVVPTTDALLIEARISTLDVAFVQPVQRALVKITAYDFSVFGGLDAEVSNISADILIVKGPTNDVIIPRMFGSVEMLTGQNSILDYLLKATNKAKNEALTGN